MPRQRHLWPQKRNFSARRTALVSFEETRAARRLRRLIRDQLDYDMALICGGYRLEWLYLEAGYPHFCLKRRREILGIVDVARPALLPDIQTRLAGYLAALGCQPEQARLFHICPPLTVDKRSLPRLPI